MEIKTLEDLFDAGGLTNQHIRETSDSNPVAWEYFRAEAIRQLKKNNPKAVKKIGKIGKIRKVKPLPVDSLGEIISDD